MECQPKKSIEKLKKTFIRLFNTEPSKGLKTPLEKKDHPELDTSDILEGQQVNHYLTMVGHFQWLITLGRFDIQAQVISMSRFRAQAKQGHLERLKRIYAYVIRTKEYATRFRTTEPDYSYLPDQNFIGLILFMVMFTKSYQIVFQILWANCHTTTTCKLESLFSHWKIFNWLFALCE